MTPPKSFSKTRETLKQLRVEAKHNLPVSPDTALLTASFGVDGGILFLTCPLRSTSSFDPPHYITRWYMRWRWQQQVHMIFANDTLQNVYFESFATLSDQLSGAKPNISLQHRVTILRDENKMVLNLKNCMTTVSIVHCPLLPFRVADRKYHS